MHKNPIILQTGFRLLTILKYLYEKDVSKIEIMERFKQQFPFLRNFSGETFKLDINTLQKAGFQIKRRNTIPFRTIYLKQKPVMFKFINEDCKVFIMAKNAALEILDVEEIIKLRDFYISIEEYLPKEYKNDVLDFKFLNTINYDVLKNLQDVIEQKQFITLSYNSPANGIKNIDCLPLKIIIRKQKIYLRCYAAEYKGSATFRLDNIIKIVNTAPQKIQKHKNNKIIYSITREFYENNCLENFENILNMDEKTVEIEVNGEDIFFAIQRILILGENCIKIENPKIKKMVLKILRKTLRNYKRCHR